MECVIIQLPILQKYLLEIKELKTKGTMLLFLSYLLFYWIEMDRATQDYFLSYLNIIACFNSFLNSERDI